MPVPPPFKDEVNGPEQNAALRKPAANQSLSSPASGGRKAEVSTTAGQDARQTWKTDEGAGVPQHRVAVLDFNDDSVMSSAQAIFGTNEDVGKGIAQLVADRLAKNARYRVMERAELDKILKAQNFSNSERADAASAAKLGRVLGVDAIIVGDITRFGRDDESRSRDGALSRWNNYGLGHVGTRREKAVAAVTARIIDVNTGEVLASATGRGESSRTGSDLLGGGSTYGTAGGRVDMSSSNFGATVIGEAVNGAVSELATQLGQEMSKTPSGRGDITGLIADVSGNMVTLNIGRRSGVRVGEKFSVMRMSRTIRDPTTGKPLRTVTEPIGQLQITAVDEGSATGTFSGASQPRVGDSVSNSEQ